MGEARYNTCKVGKTVVVLPSSSGVAPVFEVLVEDLYIVLESEEVMVEVVEVLLS